MTQNVKMRLIESYCGCRNNRNEKKPAGWQAKTGRGDHFMIPSKDAIVQHSSTPPCHCPQCLRDTAQADQRLAKIAEILARLDEVERLGGEVAE